MMSFEEREFGMNTKEVPAIDQALPIISFSEALKNLSPNENCISEWGRFLRVGIFRKYEDIYLIILSQHLGEAIGVRLWPIFDVEVNSFDIYCRLGGGDIRIIRLFENKGWTVFTETNFPEMIDILIKNQPNFQLKDKESYFNNKDSFFAKMSHDRQYTQNQQIRLSSVKGYDKEIQWNILLGDLRKDFDSITLEHSKNPYIYLQFRNDDGYLSKYSKIVHYNRWGGMGKKIDLEKFFKLHRPSHLRN